MALNSVLANGFLSVPQKFDNPMIRRHKDSIIVSAVNTIGGADDVYSARSLPDGSTLDRFYIIQISYDKAYEKSLFSLTRKTSYRAPRWKPSDIVVDQAFMDAAEQIFFTLREKTERAKLPKIVSTRLAQKMIAAIFVGIPLEEIKADLLSGWSKDELNRVGVTL